MWNGRKKSIERAFDRDIRFETIFSKLKNDSVPGSAILATAEKSIKPDLGFESTFQPPFIRPVFQMCIFCVENG